MASFSQTDETAEHLQQLAIAKDFVPQNRVENLARALTIKSLWTIYNNNATASLGVISGKNPFIVRRYNGMVEMSGPITSVSNAAITGVNSADLVTGGPGVDAGTSGFVNLFTISNAATTSALQRILFPFLDTNTFPQTVAWGTALLADAANKVTAASATAIVIQNTAVSGTSLYGNWNKAVICRVYVADATTAYVQVYLPTGLAILGTNAAVSSQMPKIFISNLRYPCVDHRTNNSL